MRTGRAGLCAMRRVPWGMLGTRAFADLAAGSGGCRGGSAGGGGVGGSADRRTRSVMTRGAELAADGLERGVGVFAERRDGRDADDGNEVESDGVLDGGGPILGGVEFQHPAFQTRYHFDSPIGRHAATCRRQFPYRTLGYAITTVKCDHETNVIFLMKIGVPSLCLVLLLILNSCEKKTQTEAARSLLLRMARGDQMYFLICILRRRS